MFDWLVEIEKPHTTDDRLEDGVLKIKRMESQSDPHIMSEVCQLFTSYSVIIGSDAMSQLPTPNEVAKNIIVNEIAPHYTDVKEIYINGVLRTINVRGLKPRSKRIIQDKLIEGIYPVVPDLYRSDNPNIATGKRDLKYFSICYEALSPLNTIETEKLRYFFQNTFFADSGSLFLAPIGWVIEDKLRESLTLRTFSVFARSIILVVDSTNYCVIGLDIYG
jgi:hypothetical protein